MTLCLDCMATKLQVYIAIVLLVNIACIFQARKWREGPSLQHALRYAQLISWRESFLIVGGALPGKEEYNDNIYYFDPSVESGIWKIWMTHKDTAREKFAAIPISKGITICSKRESTSPVVKLKMYREGHLGNGNGLVEEGEDIRLSCSASPNPGNFTVSLYFKVRQMRDTRVTSQIHRQSM